MPINTNLKVAAVSVSSSGDNTAITGVAGKTIKVYAVAITLASPIDVTCKDGASTSLGVYQGITSLVLDTILDQPRYTTTDGNDFILNLSSAVACKGTIWYTQG